MADAPGPNLDRIELLAPLDPAARMTLVRQCRWRRFQPDEMILDYQGDTHDICFIVEGRVRVVNHSMSGREISFDDIPEGGFLGEMSAIDGGPRSASVVALTDTLVAFLSARPFLDLITGHPALALALMRRLTSMNRRSTERIMDLSTLGANNRVHAELLRLARPNLGKDNIAEINPAPIHADIAARVSTTRETVARALSDLSRDKLVERRNQSLVVINFKRLQRMVEDVRGE
ncbi:CRP/FNR family transcriptional regulator, cyclic AMP receptor protein [uncultured Gammaproteobacteria bacterium]